MGAVRVNPGADDIYAAINDKRDKAWWVNNNELWKAIDWTAGLNAMAVRGELASGEIPATGTFSYTAPCPCLLAVGVHITANVNGIYSATVNGLKVHYVASQGACNCIFTQTYTLAKGDKVVIETSSNTPSSYQVLNMTTKV